MIRRIVINTLRAVRDRRDTMLGTMLVAIALAACSSGGVRGPVGWQPVPAKTQRTPSGTVSSATWTGETRETYAYDAKPFSGTLSDLSSQTAIDTTLRNHGARLLRSDPVKGCPAQAGISTFPAGDRTIQVAFAVLSGQAITITYVRPSNLKPSAAVDAAIDATLCVLPV